MPPQDIPLEASDTLAFTPESLSGLAKPPSFDLRAPTGRDKRHQRRLMAEENVFHHSVEDLRAEMLRGLKANWSPEAYAEHAPKVQEFWQARDEWELQRKDDPDLKWEYDPEMEAAFDRLEDQVRRSWPRFSEMIADNSDYQAMLPILMIAVAVTGWTGLDVEPRRERGYLTVECAEELVAALGKMAKTSGIRDAMPGTELFIACSRRFFLDGEEKKNSESPSPSETTQPVSSTTSDPGKSPASANSKKTHAQA